MARPLLRILKGQPLQCVYKKEANLYFFAPSGWDIPLAMKQSFKLGRPAGVFNIFQSMSTGVVFNPSALPLSDPSSGAHTPPIPIADWQCSNASTDFLFNVMTNTAVAMALHIEAAKILIP